jgi:hypothetical protein
MSLPETLADTAVAGDGSYDCPTFAFDDDGPMEGASSFPYATDQERLEYMEDVFEGSNDTVSCCRSLPSSAVKLDTNGAEGRMLDLMKRIVNPVLMSSSRLVQKDLDATTPADFASIYLSRDWYLLLLDYINSRIQDPVEHATTKEILEMQRDWTLQCIYGTTAKSMAKISDNAASCSCTVQHIYLGATEIS